MITIRKNDKLIIVIGVTLFAIAIVALLLYQSPIKEDAGFIFASKEKSYEVEWTVKQVNEPTISEFASKQAVYEKTVTINRANLKNIRFNLSWVDDKAFLGRVGLDTLTLEITTPDGKVFEQSAKSAPRTKAGNVEIVFKDITKAVYDVITAKTEVEAQSMLLEEPYYDDAWKNEKFTIRITVSVGEVLGNIRPRDKGNDFDLKISYEYYEPFLVLMEQVKRTSNDTVEEDDSDNVIWQFSSMFGTPIY